MGKRRKFLQRLFMPVLAFTLVLTGVPSQGIQMAEAAEIEEVISDSSGRADTTERVFGNEGETDGTEAPERMDSSEGADRTEALERIERAEKADNTDTAGGTSSTDTESQPEQADKAALAAAIQKAEGMQEADYSAESWENLQEALAAAKETNSKADADQDDVDEAAENLEAAMEELVKVPDKPGSVKVKGQRYLEGRVRCDGVSGIPFL